MTSQEKISGPSHNALHWIFCTGGQKVRVSNQRVSPFISVVVVGLLLLLFFFTIVIFNVIILIRIYLRELYFINCPDEILK